MLVFHGGFTLEQIQKFQNGEYQIYQQVPYQLIRIPGRNTFNYCPNEMKFNNYMEIQKYVSNNIFQNQYIFLFKYLRNALDYCVSSEKRNYIMVADIDEQVLDLHVGIGKDIEHQIEYRVPREYITIDHIVDFLFFQLADKDKIQEFSERFGDSYFNPDEDIEAYEILKSKNLVFNECKKIRML